VLNDDTEVVVNELKNRGYDIILITGGFDITAEHLGTKLELTHYYATSKLEFSGVGLFADIIASIEDGEAKVAILKKYLDQTGKLASDCIAVGDSSNDIPLFNFTKNGITFDWSKDVVKDAAKHTIYTLSDLLKIL